MQVILETERLFLRKMTMEDFDSLYEVLANHSIMQHYPYAFDEKSDGKYNNRLQGTDQYCTTVLSGVFAGILYTIFDWRLIRYDRRNYCPKNEYCHRVWSEILYCL